MTDKPPQIPFKIKGEFQPAGDQPSAIAKLVEGIEAGLAHQTLLGVTGSGKSIGYDDPLYLVEVRNGVEHAQAPSSTG